MSARSLNVAPQFIETVKKAKGRNNFKSNQALATESGVSRDVVTRFLCGKPVDRNNFIELCVRLGLNWQEIVEKPSKTENNPDFVGREAAITTLNELSRGAKVILIQGAGGVGKTALARNYLAAKFGDKIIEFPIAKETEDISPIEGLLEQSLRSLGEEPGRDFGVSLLRLKEKLQSQAMGVLIDNLEPALDRFGRLIEGHRRYLELLRILADPTVKSITLMTSREALGETLDISLYRLPILTLEAWQTYFQNRKILCDIQEIEVIWNAYQGNALAMKLLSERIVLDYFGNVAAFWKEQQKMGVLLTMDNLIKEQFDRLEKIDLNAYYLLCRMGCFRYQDVHTVPLEGLFCLLWDVAENQQGQVVNALKSRSLVDVINGEYQLHPLIREEAINRLRKSEDWEKANHQAAEFWTESVKTVETVDDALTAFEAYYHYLNIQNYNKAAKVIVKGRSNKWAEEELLGRSFYRLSLLEQMIKAINYIVNKVESVYLLSRLYNIQGDLYWLKGLIQKAIDCHNKSGEIATNFIKTRDFQTEGDAIKIQFEQLRQSYLLNMGLCLIELLEIDKARTFFNELKAYSESKNIQKNTICAYFGLAFTNSYFLLVEQSLNFAKQSFLETQTNKLGTWITGYRFLFIALTYKNLSEYEQSFEMCNRAIIYAEEANYSQVKGKALTGLGELYCIQKDYNTALDHHFQSIKILDKIGAKCDLAEAYFQLALTYQAMGDQPKSQTYFDQALDLWGPEQIDAPKQIERVKKAMQTNP